MNHQPCESRWSAIADRLLRWRYRFLILAIVIGAFSFSKSRHFVLERQLESMFRADDPVLKNYRQLQDKFGGNEVILVVYSDEDFWNADRIGLRQLAAMREKLLRIDGIRDVMDLSVVDQLIKKIEQPFTLFATLPLALEDVTSNVAVRSANEAGVAENQGFSNGAKADDATPKRDNTTPTGIFSKTPMAAAMLELFIGTTHAREGSWLAVACLLEPKKEPSVPRTNLIQQIRQVIATSPKAQSAFLVGEPIMVEEGFEIIEKDGLRLGWISTVVLSILMLVVCRNLRWTLLTLLVVHWSLAVTRAICVVVGWELTMVSSMLVAIVTVIGIATTMHWLFGYQQCLRSGQSSNQALQNSLRRLIRPIAWACITDALAFASLMVARVEPVRDYGFMMAVASIVTLLAIMLIGPGFASLGRRIENVIPPPVPPTPSEPTALAAVSSHEPTAPFTDRTEATDHPDPTRIESLLKSSLHLALQNRRITLVFLGIWLAFVIVGSTRLEVETDFLQNFNRHSPLVQGYTIVESQMEGAGVWDVLIPAPAVLTNAYFEQVTDLENQLLQLDQGRLSKVVSLVGAEAAARQSPLLAKLPITARLTGMRIAMPSFFDSLITPQEGLSTRTLRIMLRSSDRVEASEKLALINAVERCIQTKAESDEWKQIFESNRTPSSRTASPPNAPIVTGYYVLLSHLVQSVVSDQWICLAIATLAIGIALRLAIGNWRLAAVALVPNTLPALGSIAALGIIGMKMNIGAAMIAAVSIGLSVDSSLHYLIDYQRRRNAGLSCMQALELSQTNVGFPVIFSTLALVVGFASLTTSDFFPTAVFGTLAAITMSIGLLGNLWWLPVLIEMVDTRKK